MATATSIEVYQDGVQREMAISSDVDTSSYMNKVKTGSSIEVKLVYGIEGTSDVEVEVYELFSLDKATLASQTFSLA